MNNNHQQEQYQVKMRELYRDKNFKEYKEYWQNYIYNSMHKNLNAQEIGFLSGIKHAIESPYIEATKIDNKLKPDIKKFIISLWGKK